MDASVSTDCDLRTAHAASRNCAARLMIDLNRRRKCGPAISGADVKHVPVRRIASKVNQMDGSVAVDGRLKSRTWEQDGRRRDAVEVVARRVEFLTPPDRANGGEVIPFAAAAV